MYFNFPLLGNIANPSLILDISIHGPEEYGKEDLEYGDHSRIKETFAPLNVVGTLDEEFKIQRGQIIVSRKSRPQSSTMSCPITNLCVTLKVCADKAVSDKARNYVQLRMDKRVRLVELDFQPSSRETGRLSSADLELSCIG